MKGDFSLRGLRRNDVGYQMMMMGGGPLVIAAVLLGLREQTRASWENAPLRDYLERIAMALEKLERPRAEETSGEDGHLCVIFHS
jgi:hypothetical protein